MTVLPTQKTRNRGGIRATQKARTRQRMIDAGRRLFAERGYEGTTVALLAAGAGVSPGLITAHFGSKAGLMFAILTDQNAAQLDQIESDLPKGGTLRERLLRKLRTEYEHDLADPKLTAVLVSYSWVWPAETEAENLPQRQAGDALVRQILLEGAARGEAAADADLDAAVTAIYAIYLWGLRPGFYEGTSAEDCLSRIAPQIDLILRGLRAQGSARA